MKKTNFYSLLLLLFITVNLCFSQNISTEHSKVKFEISNMLFRTVIGDFKFIEGEIHLPLDNLTNAKIEACIDVKSVNTRNIERDNHLRNEDFFDVDKHPNICFYSSSVTKTDNGFLATGNLSLHGIIKEIKVPFTFSNNKLVGSLSIDRLEYGLGPSNGFMVGKEVEISIIAAID